jgi:hypothetical protein
MSKDDKEIELPEGMKEIKTTIMPDMMIDTPGLIDDQIALKDIYESHIFFSDVDSYFICALCKKIKGLVEEKDD